MGKQAKMIKERVCRECQQVYFCDAKTIKKHAELCKRAQAAGIILPGVVRPDITIVGG